MWPFFIFVAGMAMLFGSIGFLLSGGETFYGVLVMMGSVAMIVLSFCIGISHEK